MKNEIKYLKSDFLLLIAAVIWGGAFVAQRIGMKYIGPFTFTGLRFFMGAVVLIPIMLRSVKNITFQKIKKSISFGILPGLLMFGGVNFQQVGLVHTTAGKAGFITGLYVIIVPLIGFLWKIKPNKGEWLGAIIAIIGLFLLSIKNDFTMSYGDFLIFICAIIWAFQIHVINKQSKKTDVIQLAFVQFMICSILSMIVAIFTEEITIASIKNTGIPLLYGGLFSVGIAFTLQVVCQKKAPVMHVSIIISLEAVFAALSGWLILGEVLSTRSLTGCILMMAGMIVAQLWPKKRN